MAVQVFGEKGYDAGSLDDVAASLDLRKASLYHYVRSKAHLLYLIFDRAITLALGRMRELSRKEDPAERLAALVRHQVTTIAEEPSLFAVFFDQRPRLHEDYEADVREKEREYVSVYVDAVRDAARAGVIPPVDPRYGAQLILGMTSWSYKWLRPARDDPEAVADDCIRLLLGRDTASSRSSRGPRAALRRAR